MNINEEPWRPLSRRHDPGYDSLHEGIPAWLWQSAWDWAMPWLQSTRATGIRSGSGTSVRLSGSTELEPNRAVLKLVERRLRIGLDWSRGDIGALESLRVLTVHDSDHFLDLLDLLLDRLGPSNASADILDSILKEAGSAWNVRHRQAHYCLERRILEAVVVVADQVISAAGRAGKHLEAAWSAVYGRHPNASQAYREAVRAIEASAALVVSPDNSVATLGSIIRDMKASPPKWSVALTPPPAFDCTMTLIGMLELLWKSQFDRHGTPSDDVPLTVSAVEAEAAVHLAATLAHWFTTGVVERVRTSRP
jgi:hypothetical protein